MRTVRKIFASTGIKWCRDRDAGSSGGPNGGIGSRPPSQASAVPPTSGRPRRKPGPQSQALALPPWVAKSVACSPLASGPTVYRSTSSTRMPGRMMRQTFRCTSISRASCSGLVAPGRRTSRSPSPVLSTTNRSARSARAGHRAGLGLRFVVSGRWVACPSSDSPDSSLLQMLLLEPNGEPGSSLPRRGEPDAGLSRSGCGSGLSVKIMRRWRLGKPPLTIRLPTL